MVTIHVPTHHIFLSDCVSNLVLLLCVGVVQVIKPLADGNYHHHTKDMLL